MKVLVTGANGFVGNNLVRVLIAQGYQVRAMIHKGSEALTDLDLEIVSGDILSISDVESALAGVQVVYHAAAYIDIEGTQRERLLQINVQGTANVVAACLRLGIRKMIHFSSIHALSYRPRAEAIDEGRLLALTPDHAAYDYSKALAEREVLAGVDQGLNAVILNPVGVIGPYDFAPSALGESLLQIHHRELPGLVKGGFYWVDVRDVALAAILAEHKGRMGERYIIHSEYQTIPQLALWVKAVTGVKLPRLSSPIWLAYVVSPFMKYWSILTGKRPLFTRQSIEILRCHQVIKSTKARDELGFTARSVEESVRDALRWFAAHGRFKMGAILESSDE